MADKDEGGLRAVLNRNPMLAGGAVLAVLAAAFLIWSNVGKSMGHGSLYYSDDDGKTWFTAPVQATPFMKDGKEVDEAVLFKCGDRTFVGYLKRWPADVHDQVARQLKLEKPGRLPASEVKRPGDTGWTKEVMMAGAGPSEDGKPSSFEIMTPKCEDGSYAAQILANR